MFFYNIALFAFFLASVQSVVEFTLIIPFMKEDCQTQLHFGILGLLNLCILIAVKPLTDIDAIDAFHFCSPIFSRVFGSSSPADARWVFQDPPKSPRSCTIS